MPGLALPVVHATFSYTLTLFCHGWLTLELARFRCEMLASGNHFGPGTFGLWPWWHADKVSSSGWSNDDPKRSGLTS